MTKQRHCFVAQVGDAIEALASALDPEREPPFKGDILDLLEWAERDVLEMRAEVVKSQRKLGQKISSYNTFEQLRATEFRLGKASRDAEVAELRQQLAECHKLLDESKPF